MNIIVEEHMFDTDHILKITDLSIYSLDYPFNVSFTIVLVNRKEIHISERLWTPEEIMVWKPQVYYKSQKDLFESYEHQIKEIKQMRQDIIDLWKNTKSNIQTFNLENYKKSNNENSN